RDDGGRAGGDASGPVCKPPSRGMPGAMTSPPPPGKTMPRTTSSRPVRAHCRPPAGRSAAVPARMRVGLIAACMPGLALAAGVPDATAESRATHLAAVLAVAQRASRVRNGALDRGPEARGPPPPRSRAGPAQLRRFGADSVNEALRLATGVRVDEWETNRTSYGARGFDILNTQVDGVGMPNSWGIATGAIDAFGYEKVEVIRGANGLLTGVGNA